MELARDRSQLLSVAHHNRTHPDITWPAVLQTCDRLYTDAGAPWFDHHSHASLITAPDAQATAAAGIGPCQFLQPGRHSSMGVAALTANSPADRANGSGPSSTDRSRTDQ